MPDTRQGTEEDSGGGARNQSGRRALKITAIYMICGFLWIILSDRVLGALVRDSAVLTRLQTYKGWIFILVTAALVYFLSRRALLKTERLALITRESERRFRALFENVSVVALVVDPTDGGILDANEAAAKFYGWTREELRAMRITQINILAAEEVRARMDEAKSRKQGFFLFKHRRSDGSIRDVEVYSGPIQFEGKTALYSFIHDITERMQAEDALRESEEHFRAITMTASDAILLMDDRGQIVHWNPAAVRMFGYTVEEALGKDLHLFLAPLRMHEDYLKGFRDFIKTGQGPVINRSVELAAVKKDGTEFPIEVSTSAMHVGGRWHALGIVRDITERKRSELALRESEAKYRRLYNETPVLLHSIDREGVLVEVNDYWLKTLGYGRSEVIGRQVTDFYTDASKKYAREVVHPTFFRDGVVKDVPFQFVKKNGEIVEVLLSATAERDAAGNVLRSQAMIVDISERKHAENLLLRSEARYRMLYEGTPVMMHSIDTEGKLISVSNHWLKTLGYTRQEVLGRRSVEFLDDASRVYARTVILPDFMRTGVCTDVPYTFVKKNGERISTLLSAIAERDDAGKVVRSLAVIIDITERKKAEEGLRAAKEYAENLIETANTIVVGLDLGGNVTIFNHAAETITGYTRAELQGKNWFEVLVPRTRYPHVWAEFERLVNGGLPKNFENPILTKTGEERYIVWQNNEVYEEGKVAGSISFGVDITERRLLEEERLKTQKLESVGTLAGGIAHDFNNLLQGIFGYISMARMTIDQKEKSLAMLEQAEKALHHSVNLTTQLLTFSKGGKPVKWKISLAPVIENAVRFALSGSRADARIELDHDLSPVEADEGQIAQVLQNLVLNADQAMPTGGIVKISAGNVQAPGPGIPSGLGRGTYVRISVADSGVGIPEQYLTKIFDPYFTTKEKGSGLGLATSYSIIRNHEGVIDVRSRAGAGSTFTIYLPAAAGDAPPVAPAATAPAATRRGRVLVMDDEEVVRKVAGELIRLLGHEAEFAGDGTAAIGMYRAAREAGKPFDVVILDLTIRGGMGGIETMRLLREIDPGVKAVVSSGYSDDDAVSDRLKHGFRAFLKKPYTIEALREILNALLD